MDIIVLKARLDKIADNKDVENSVNTAEQVLRKYAEIADETQRQLRKRGDSDFLKTQLEVDDLNRVGNYHGKRKSGKDVRTISFADSDHAVEFHFKYTGILSDEFFGEMMGRNVSDEERYSSVDGLISDKILDRKTNTVSGYLSGSDSRTLRGYVLDRVDVLTFRNAMGIPWFPSRKTVYRHE